MVANRWYWQFLSRLGLLVVLISVVLPFSVYGGDDHNAAETERQDVPWVRVFSSEVVRFYALSNNAQRSTDRVRAEDVFILLSDPEVRAGDGGLRLARYIDGSIKSPVCQSGLNEAKIRDGLEESDGSLCDRVIEHALVKFSDVYRGCRAREEALSETHYLMIDASLNAAYCVYRTSDIYVAETKQPTTLLAFTLFWEGDGFLSLNQNRSVGCYHYGRLLTGLSGDLPMSLPSYSRRPRLLEGEPIWRHNYLIRTPGFSYCRGSKIFLDQPEIYHGIVFLTDDTVLVGGNVSVLRVRQSDGLTNAPTDVVQTYAPGILDAEIKTYTEGKCTGEWLATSDCPLVDVIGFEYDKDAGEGYHRDAFYPAVIESVDFVLRKVFEEHLRTQNSDKKRGQYPLIYY